MNGFCHIEICTTDLAETRRFLEGLFGWEFQEISPEYWLFSSGDGPGGGLEKVAAPKGRGDIQVYVEVSSIDEVLDKAREAGGEVEAGKTGIGGGFGAYAMLRAPGGAVFGLWQAEAA